MTKNNLFSRKLFVPKFQKILLILAAHKNESKRDGFVVDLCQEFGETLQSQGSDIDWIDLYADTEKGEFGPFDSQLHKDTKIIEYQFRVKRADCIIFFHPVRWNSVPAILKGFLDQVFSNGFAYKYEKSKLEPCLVDKSALVFSFSETLEWQNKLYYNNTLETFWKRGIFDVCGIKGYFSCFGGLRDFSEKRIQSVRNKVLRYTNKLGQQESWLDLF